MEKDNNSLQNREISPKNGVCYLVGAGEMTEGFLPQEDDLVIAADGGYAHLLRFGIRCDLLIGDFDSLDRIPDETETIRFPVRKDETDAFLAFREGYARGYREFCLYGGGGGREDHTVANFSLLYHARLAGCRARMELSYGCAEVVRNETRRISGAAGKHFSAFAFAGAAEGVSIRGMEYECENITLRPEFPLAVSNRFLGKEGEISVRSGALLIMTER